MDLKLRDNALFSKTGQIVRAMVASGANRWSVARWTIN
jgi:hypothetical protein